MLAAMRIAIATDHAAVGHTRAVAARLRALGHEVVDFGTDRESPCDYPDHAIPAAEAVATGACARGVLLCGSGIGMSIAANKVAGVRCALAHSVATAKLAASHNHANVLALGARIVDEATALAMVEVWLATAPEARHQGRLDKITAYEKGHASC